MSVRYIVRRVGARGSPFFLVLVLVFVGLHLHMNYICPPALAVHPPKSLIETGAQRGQPQHKE